MGRPQGEINKQIGAYDIFVGIMWKRFGTPTGKANSGTEEEFRRAYDMWEKNKTPRILFYFCTKPFMPKSQEDVEQIGRVIKFHNELSTKGTMGEYSDHENFSDTIRVDLTRVIGEIFQRTFDDDQNLLHKYWDLLEPALQDAFALAYNQSRREGSNIIETRYLFAAIRNINPKPLNELLELLPKESLPQPIKENDKTKVYVLEEDPNFSSCVRDSLMHIGQLATPKRKLSPEDVFVDIAKHGKGSSVARLRTWGLSAEKIDQIVRQLGWRVIERY
jgi:hypothetical protein